MRTFLRSKVTLLFMTCAVILFVFPAMASAQGAPTIQSDQADYPPGATVTLTGSNWQPGESVHINVNDTYGATWSHSADVTADASGNITDSFNLPNAFVSDYDVTATGAQSGVATTSFTDANLKLYSDSNRTTERAVFERGDTVYARGNGLANGASYKLQVLNKTNQEKALSQCFDSATNSNADFSYTIQSTDELSDSSSFSFKLLEYPKVNAQTPNTNCSGNPDSNPSTAPFRIAKAFAFDTPTAAGACTNETTNCSGAKTSFSPGSLVFVSVLGYSNQGNPVNTTWLRTATSPTLNCANTSGQGRAVPNSAGRVPGDASSYLQYPPTGGATWNTLSTYETQQCPPLAPG